jgi:transposase
MTTLTMKEEKRLEVIQRVFRGELTVEEAAVIVGVSKRQCYRIKDRVTKQGAKGVVHGNRGRHRKRKFSENKKRRIVELVSQGEVPGIQRSPLNGETSRAGAHRDQS